MDQDKLRNWIVVTSILATFAQMVFFLAAPIWGYPLDYPDALKMMLGIIPLFMGYASSGVAYFIKIISANQENPNPKIHDEKSFYSLNLLAKLSMIIYLVALFAFIVLYGISHKFLPRDKGMEPYVLNIAITTINGFMAATVSGIAGWLFESEDKKGENTSTKPPEAAKPNA